MKKLHLINLLIAFVVLAGIFTVAKHFYMRPAMAGGEKAPDFTALTHEGKGFKLSDLKGQYVLLDFWGSWCGPCIVEAPALVQLYGKFYASKFKDADGFTIVSVAIEKDRERWMAAIERLGHNWPYQAIDPVSNFRFFDSPIASAYGVKQLPTKFLIGPGREVVGVDMPLAEVENYLSERVEK
jgi:thiol-disulfide isomerase/thioredoxin